MAGHRTPLRTFRTVLEVHFGIDYKTQGATIVNQPITYFCERTNVSDVVSSEQKQLFKPPQLLFRFFSHFTLLREWLPPEFYIVSQT